MRIHYRIRNSIFGFGLAAAVFFVSAWAQSVDAENEGEYTNRYLQHKEAAEAASWSYVEGELNERGYIPRRLRRKKLFE